MGLRGTGLHAHAWQICAMLVAILGFGPAQAQIGSSRYASFIMQADTGEVLSAVQADELAVDPEHFTSGEPVLITEELR